MPFDFACLPQTPLRAAIDALLRAPEKETILALCGEATLPVDVQREVTAKALELVTNVRARRTRSSGVDALMREFSLSSDEGVALMCLAEALLRIPDSGTRDALIRDKIGGANWQAHLGQSPSLFVNAASWGLLLTGKLVTTHSENSLGSALTRLIGKGGEPVIRKAVDLAMRMLGRQFVTGETIEGAIANGQPNLARGYRYSYDMLGEAAMTRADAKRYLEAYQHAIDVIGAHSKAQGDAGVRLGPGISIKLSALHPRYQRAQRQSVMAELLPVIRDLALRARSYNIGLNIDAEESERLDLSLDLLEAIAADPGTSDWDGLGFVIQAYSKRAPAVIDWVISLARSHQRRLMVRLVKGAYWDSEIKRAQIEGQKDYPVYTRKVHTDVAYQACARRLLAATDAIYPQFATHNAYTLAWVREAAKNAKVPVTDYEFQCLHGMGETLYDQVVDVKEGLACRIYAPVGSHETLLAYLVRRLLENGANSSFVNRIVDENIPVAMLAADPVAGVAATGGAVHPRIPLPPDLYGTARRNSLGFDAASEAALQRGEDELNAFASHQWSASADANGQGRTHNAVLNPSDLTQQVGTVLAADRAVVDAAIANAVKAKAWSDVAGIERAAILERAADAIEHARMELIALLMREAGKSFINAIGEVREAADFCRYYAAQIRTTPLLQRGGPMVCISPWNFPLAIFCGQVVAALAAGRCVLAKPAEQTPLVAARATQLLHGAGVPKDVLQLLPGDGPTVGAPLVASHAIGGVLFTGSTEVARGIASILAERDDDPILVAETGGVNAMMVDSSALTEQVVQDVLVSAFDSAGQRCSALRLLCVQEDAAEAILSMLYGGFADLTVGSPECLAHDIGPVIDQESKNRLEAHIEKMAGLGHKITRLTLPDACRRGTFVAPTIIEIDSVENLPGEVFGPVLHVLRYPASQFDAVIDAINAQGYGLTMGIHSRIDEHIERLRERANVGNLYVNRNMVGAVVGVQPFGGEGMSGTGPKAGGPLYLPRLGLGLPVFQIPSQPEAATPTLGRRLAQADLTDEQKTRLHRLGDRLMEQSLAGLEVQLAGPTGESNSLRFVGRARIACVAADRFETIKQAMVVLALGGHAYAPAEMIDPALNATIAPLKDETMLDALLVSDDLPEIKTWRRQMAARRGAIVQVVPMTTDETCIEAGVLARLLHERSVSINTAAAGGNAALMVLGEA